MSNRDSMQLFLEADAPLRPADAVAAILVHEDGRYVMQLRDSKPSMFWPGHWGCFGGGVDKGEDPRQTLARELREELEIDPAAATEFTRITFDLRPVGHPVSSRLFFIVPISAQALSRCVLHEGEAVEAIGADELLTRRRVTPYDCFAIWMHYSRARLLAGAA